MSTLNRRLRPAVAALTLAVLSTSSVTMMPTTADAQSLRRMSCQQLWYERNAIFARFGYCFETQRARAVFGRACFPPYGKLPGWAQARVYEIEAEEGGRC